MKWLRVVRDLSFISWVFLIASFILDGFLVENILEGYGGFGLVYMVILFKIYGIDFLKKRVVLLLENR